MNQQRQSVTEIEKQANPKPLPLFFVILHNDDHNLADFVVRCVMQVFHLTKYQSEEIMLEADANGSSICTITYFERAEFLRDQLRSFGLTSSIEPV